MAFSAARDAIRAAEDGKCNSSYQYLKTATLMYGKTIAEHEGAARGNPSPALTKEVHHAMDRFQNYCIRR